MTRRASSRATCTRIYRRRCCRRDTRNLAAFSRFLEAASFGQANVLNIASIARDCAVERKGRRAVVHSPLGPVARRASASVPPRAKRDVTCTGVLRVRRCVYRTLRPRARSIPSEEIDGAALETLVLNELRAINSYRQLGYELFTWRTHTGFAVDFVLYGKRGLHAIEVKRTSQIRGPDLEGLQLFAEDYPVAKRWLLYGGSKASHRDDVHLCRWRRVCGR